MAEVELGTEYRMDTGEKVRAGATWSYATPLGEQQLVRLTLIEPHTFVGSFVTDDGEERKTHNTLRKHVVYHLTPAELARNGKRIDAVGDPQ